MKTVYVRNRLGLCLSVMATACLWLVLYKLVQSGGISKSSILDRASGLERLVGNIFFYIYCPAVYVLLLAAGPISLVRYSKCVICNGNKLIVSSLFGVRRADYYVGSIEKVEIVAREMEPRWLFRKTLPKCRIVFRSGDVIRIDYESHGYDELIECLQKKGCALIYA